MSTLRSSTFTGKVGEIISQKIEAAESGDGVVDRLALFLAHGTGFAWFHPAKFIQNEAVLRGLPKRLKSLPTGDTIVLGSPPHHPGAEQSSGREEREFHLRLAIREKWSKRELEHQFRTAPFERAVLSPHQ
jgi:hypothetical protein